MPYMYFVEAILTNKQQSKLAHSEKMDENAASSLLTRKHLFNVTVILLPWHTHPLTVTFGVK